MVGAEELRIGNYVLKDGIPIRTIARDIYRISNGLTTRETIPLTEEWLLKFGFERVESPVPETHPWPDYVKDNVVISMPYFEFSYSYGDDPVEIKYVHSIQNLFFAVKQRELEVK